MNTLTSHRQILYGLTADTHFLNLLNQPQFSGKVEQVFNKAINISIDNSLFTLLSSPLDNAPNSCRLLNKDFSLLDIKSGDSFYLLDKDIAIGECYLLSFSLCKQWQKPIIEFIPEKIEKKDYQLFLRNQLKTLDLILNSNESSLFNYQGDNVFYLSSSEKLKQLRLSLIKSLEKQEHQNLVSIINQFIGLGIGLTPSGDDYLVGLMAFLLLKNHPAYSFYPEFYQGITQSKERTTPISAITLEKALGHEYRENMHQLIQSLVDAKETEIYSQFLAILNIGSSSGSDMLFGIRDALYLTHYFGERYVD